MAVYTSSGSFEPESITHEQRMEVWAKKTMKFTRIVKSASSTRTMKRDPCEDVSIYASRVYVVSNNEQYVSGF